jgi:hypothetical protein
VLILALAVPDCGECVKASANPKYLGLTYNKMRPRPGPTSLFRHSVHHVFPAPGLSPTRKFCELHTFSAPPWLWHLCLYVVDYNVALSCQSQHRQCWPSPAWHGGRAPRSRWGSLGSCQGRSCMGLAGRRCMGQTSFYSCWMRGRMLRRGGGG